jgi:hypothetical protein
MGVAQSGIAFTAVSFRIHPRGLARFLIAVSFLYGFRLIYDMNGYMPWLFKFMKALEQSFLAHFGLWLATLQVQSRLRFLIAAMMVPSMVIVFFMWWGQHLTFAIAAGVGMSWLLFRVLQGKRLGY